MKNVQESLVLVRVLLAKLFTPAGLRFCLWSLLGILLLDALQHHVTVDRAVYDRMLELKYALLRRGERNDKIVIIKLTDEAARMSRSAGKMRLEQQFPRDVLAELVREVSAFKPTVMVLDIFLEEPSLNGPSQDQELRESLKAAPRVLLAQDIMRFKVKIIPVQVNSSFVLPNVRTAPAFFKEESDRVVRRVPLQYQMTNGAADFTLPVHAAAAIAPIKLHRLPLSAALSFRGNPTNFFRSISAEGILQAKRLGNGAVKDLLGEAISTNTVVILGPFHAATRDVFPAPRWIADDRGSIQGSYLLAYAIHTLAEVGVVTRFSEFAREWVFPLGFGVLGFLLVCLRVIWPEKRRLDWRVFWPIVYGLLAGACVIWPGWLLPISEPLVGYAVGRHLGDLFLQKFGPTTGE